MTARDLYDALSEVPDAAMSAPNATGTYETKTIETVDEEGFSALLGGLEL